MAGEFRFSPSDLGNTSTPDVGTAVMNSFFKAQENMRQNREEDRQTARFPMEQQRFNAQMEQVDYEKTLRPLREEQMKLGLASDMLTVQTLGAELTLKQGQIRGQQLDLGAQSGVLNAFQNNPTIQRGIAAGVRLYGPDQTNPTQGAPTETSSSLGPAAQAMNTYGVRAPDGGPVMPTGGAELGPNPILPGADGSPPPAAPAPRFGATRAPGEPTARITVPAPNGDREDLANAYIESQSIVESALAANGGRQTPAIAAMIKQAQGIQMAALSDPAVRDIVMAKQAQKGLMEMRRDIEGLPLPVREYLKRVIPEPEATNPQAVAMARASRMEQVQSYYRDPTGWLSNHGITTEVTRDTPTYTQQLSRINSYFDAAMDAVKGDPAKERQVAAARAAALADPTRAVLPEVTPATVEAKTVPVTPAERLTIQGYYNALRRAAEDDEDEIKRLNLEEAAALLNHDAFRPAPGSGTASTPGAVVPPKTRFEQAVK